MDCHLLFKFLPNYHFERPSLWLEYVACPPKPGVSFLPFQDVVNMTVLVVLVVASTCIAD